MDRSSPELHTSPVTTTTTTAAVPDPAAQTFDAVLQSDIGVEVLLGRLKQCLAGHRDLAAFFKDLAALYDKHAAGQKKLAAASLDALRGGERKHGQYALAVEDSLRRRDGAADADGQFALQCSQMAAELAEQAKSFDERRKTEKQSALAAEKRAATAEEDMNKARSKRDRLADELDRVRTGDRSNRGFGRLGTRSQAQQEEDTTRKLQAADSDYQLKTQHAQQLRQSLLQSERPTAVHRLLAMIRELDAQLCLQLGYYVSHVETLIARCGQQMLPINGRDDPQRLANRVAAINSEEDLRTYINSFAARMGNTQRELKYEPAMSPGGPSKGPMVAAAPGGETEDGHGMGGMPSGTPGISAGAPGAPTGAPGGVPIGMPGGMPGASTGPPGPPGPPTGSGMPPGPGTSGGMGSGKSGAPGGMSGMSGLSTGMSGLSMGTPNGPGAAAGMSGVSSATPPGMPAAPGSPTGSPGSAQPARPTFNMRLQQLYDRDGTPVPLLVHQCIQAVDLYGLKVDGIYRVSGTAAHIQRLRNRFDTDPLAVDFREPDAFFHDINAVTGLLKQFFRDLPGGLLTEVYYRDFIQAAKIDDADQRRDALHATINALPDTNYATLRALCLHLMRVQEHEAANRMTSANLAICFGPTILVPANTRDLADAGWQVKAMETVFANTTQIFDDD